MGAVLFSQLPNFIAQYVQNLSGRLAEFKMQVDQLTQLASQFHKTVPEFVAQGHLLKALFDRYSHLQTALQALQGARKACSRGRLN